MVSAHDVRDALLSLNWALVSFFLVKLTPFELISKNLFQNVGGILLFALFVLLFELFGKELLWEIVGKHHRIGRQLFVLFLILILFAGIFTIVA